MLNAIQRAAIRHLVAYEFSPSESRLKHTEWCELMGVTTRTLERWRKDEEFDKSYKKALEDAQESQDPFALYARQYALEQLLSMLQDKKMSPTEKRRTIKDIMAATEHVADAGEAVDYNDLTDDDLEAIALNRNVSVLAMTEEQLKGVV